MRIYDSRKNIIQKFIFLSNIRVNDILDSMT